MLEPYSRMVSHGRVCLGLGLYGQSVYLAELHWLHGRSSSLIGSAITTFYLSGALLVTRGHVAVNLFGPRAMLRGGSVLQLQCALAALWGGTRDVLRLGLYNNSHNLDGASLWFDTQRGLAISLASNGASAAGFLVTPALAGLSQRHGLIVAANGSRSNVAGTPRAARDLRHGPVFAAQKRSRIGWNATGHSVPYTSTPGCGPAYATLPQIYGMQRHL